MELNRFKAPVGSLVIDAAMVAALIWWGSGVTSTLDSINARLIVVEQANEQRLVGYQRLTAVEVELSALRREVNEAKNDNTRRLERIESKLDQIR